MALLRLFVFLCLLLPSFGQAAFIELGLSSNYRKSNLDADNFTETKSLTGSVSYYFMALSALEFSFTQGLTTVETDRSLTTGQTTKTEFQLLGLDFILSSGEREDRFRPYVKAGIVHVSSKIIIENNFATDTIKPESGIAPSVGVGVKILLNKHFSLRFGADMWSSPLSQDPIEYNYAGRAGISWLF